MTTRLLEAAKNFGYLAVSDVYQKLGKLGQAPSELPAKEAKILQTKFGMAPADVAACVDAFRVGFEEGNAEMRAAGVK